MTLHLLFLVLRFSVHSGCSCQTGRLFPQLCSPAKSTLSITLSLLQHSCVYCEKNSNHYRTMLHLFKCVSLVYSAVQCLTMAIRKYFIILYGKLLYNFYIVFLLTSFNAVYRRISADVQTSRSNPRQKLIKIRRINLVCLFIISSIKTVMN